MESLELRLETASSKTGLRLPFIMAATGKVPVLVVDDAAIPTAGTNGAWIKFNREWCEKACDDNDKLFGLMLHERMHILFMHMFRRDGRDMGLWNEANDAIINRNIKDMGYALPEGGVDIPWVKADMSSEEVYDRLKKEQPPPPPKGVGGQGGGPKGGWDNQGDLEDAPDQGAQGDLEATIRAAAQMARDCGDKSAMVDRILGTPAKATVNWKDEVRAALTSSSRDDFTYRRFSRRFVGRGLYLPSLHSDSLGGLLIGFDTSGSMSEEDCRQVAGEIQGIIDDLSPDWVEVVYCDSKIKSTQRFTKGDQLELRPKGGGGTAFKSVFDYADKLQTEGGERIAALIYLTDMEGPMDDLVEPEFPVVWGCVYARPSAAPFGAVVQVVV